MLTPLTPKQQRFCDEYLIDLNATKAALRAGYSGATALSGQLMLLPKIKHYLSDKIEEAQQKAQVTQGMIIAELAKVAFGSMGRLFDDKGQMKNMNEISEDDKAALWNLRVSEKNGEMTFTIKMHNKMSALDRLAKYTGLYDKQEPQVEYVHCDERTLDYQDTLDDDAYKQQKEEEEQLKQEQEEERQEQVQALSDERIAQIRQEAIAETEQKMRAEFEEELTALYKDLTEEARIEAEAAKKNTDKAGEKKSTFMEPIGYRLEQKRNKRRAVPHTHFAGWKL
jgi:phage terminase small subunit